MKKITFRITPESESQQLYLGIPEISGEWLMTTPGDPITTEDADDHAIAVAEAFVNGDTAATNRLVHIWEEETVNDSDLEYIQDTLEAWGIA